MLRKILIILLVAAVILVGAIFWLTREHAQVPIDQMVGPNPNLTAPRERLLPTIHVPDAVGWQPGGKPVAATGLAVKAFASGLEHPRWLLGLPNGDVLVAESNAPPRPPSSGGFSIRNFVQGLILKRIGAGGPSANRITLLRDADGDGVAELKTPLLTAGLNSPFGMALVGDTLYIANTNALVRVPFKVGDTKITATPEKIVDLPGGGHWARNVIAAPDGKKLYVTVGSMTNIADAGFDAEKERAAIWEVDPATKDHRIFAGGLRNPNGLAWEPNSKMLWTVVNERDMIGSDLVPDYLTSVQFGGFYGWPWYYYGTHTDTRVPADPEGDRTQYVIRPDYALGPHVAALGLTFSQGETIGPRFANGAFVGLHGSWNRKPLSGYKVVYIPFAANGRPVPTAKPVDILTGFHSPDEKKVWGRPVGVILDRTGALLVSDDVGNTIWRVSSATPAPAAAPKP